MSYRDFDLNTALKQLEINRIRSWDEKWNNFSKEFIIDEPLSLSEIFLEDINFSLKVYEMANIHSESWIRENLISPFLRKIWKSYAESLYVWQGIALNADVEKGLTGEPDYYVTKNTGGPEAPFCIIGEAKKENFENGWGQCLAGMRGAQILNKKENIDVPVYGVVTSGIKWQFGKLEENNFLIYPKDDFSVFDSSSKILSILDIIFKECEKYISKDK